METIPDITLSEAQEQTPQTVTRPAERIKNPKRVAQGKRLAAISRAAKQRKKERIEKEQIEENKEPLLNFSTVIAIIGAFTAVVSTCIAYSQMSTETNTQKEEPKTQKQPNILDKFSLA